MATSSVLQSLAATPLTRRAAGFSSSTFSRQQLRVQCMAAQENDAPKGTASSDSTPVTPGASKIPLTPPPAAQKMKEPASSTKFGDVLAFSGPAPERINGRLAMIGFVSAIAVELSSGQDVLTQISNGGVPWFLGTSVLLSLASLVPLFKGVSAQSKSDGFMTSDAEMWNGRVAMLGLLALAFTEYVKGSALV